jgi:hypothetical protein
MSASGAGHSSDAHEFCGSAGLGESGVESVFAVIAYPSLKHQCYRQKLLAV